MTAITMDAPQSNPLPADSTEIVSVNALCFPSCSTPDRFSTKVKSLIDIVLILHPNASKIVTLCFTCEPSSQRRDLFFILFFLFYFRTTLALDFCILVLIVLLHI